MMKSWPTWSNFQACAAIDIKALQEQANKEHVRSLRLQEVCSKYFNIFQDVQVFCSRPETMEHGFLVGCHRGPWTTGIPGEERVSYQVLKIFKDVSEPS